jgi:hypothetical protein
LTRGMQGVAGVYTDVETGQRRVRPSFLFLPIREPKKKNDHQDTELSTTVPFQMIKWLINPVNALYTQADYEKALYKFIAEEADRWVLLHAACTVSERSTFDATQRRVATECHDDVIATAEEETCCAIYDPQLGPYLIRHRNDDDDIDVERRRKLRQQRG